MIHVGKNSCINCIHLKTVAYGNIILNELKIENIFTAVSLYILEHFL